METTDFKPENKSIMFKEGEIKKLLHEHEVK